MLALLVAVAPRAVRAQAEAAPASYQPPPGVPISVDPKRIEAEREAQRRKWLVVVEPRFVVAISTAGARDLPRYGWGLGAGISRALFVAGRTRIGLGVYFSYERQQRDAAQILGGGGNFIEGRAWAAFSLDLRLEGFYVEGRLRPWASLGPSVSIGSFFDQAAMVSITPVMPGLRAAVGITYEIAKVVELGPRLEVNAAWGPEVGNPAFEPLTPGNVSVGLDVGFRF